jgi:secreted PhoX family phosphatase
MAKYSVSYTSLTFTAAADTADIADGSFLSVQGGSATQRILLSEVYIGGEAASTSSPTIMVVARDSTKAAATVSGGRMALLDGSATAPGTVPVYGTSTNSTQPQRSATDHLLHLSFNAYGGIVRWVAAPGSEIAIVTATAPAGSVSLSAFTGGTPGATSGHFIIEVV